MLGYGGYDFYGTFWRNQLPPSSPEDIEKTVKFILAIGGRKRKPLVSAGMRVANAMARESFATVTTYLIDRSRHR
jgi:hypothetical protein